MAINFPATAGQPTDGSFTHTSAGIVYSWDGSSWNAAAGAVTFNQVNLVNDPSPRLSGHLDLNQYNITDTLGSNIDIAGQVVANSIRTSSFYSDATTIELTLAPGSSTFNGTITATGGNSTNWNSAYGWGNHAVVGYLTSLGDAAGVTAAKIGTWDTAYGWGDHSTAGYLTSETSHADVVLDGDFTTAGLMTTDGSGGYSITTNNSSDWDTAYGWGDHSTAGYLTTETQTLDAVLTSGATTTQDITTTGTLTTGNLTAGGLTYPSSNGSSSQVLTSDGAGNVTWTTFTGGVSSFALNNVTDVTITSATQHQLLAYDGSGWINTYPSIQHLIDVKSDTNPNNGDLLQWVDGDNNYEYRTPYSIVYNVAEAGGSPTTGQVLGWDGTNFDWVSISGYTDADVDTHLNQSNPTQGNVLSWNGTDYAWIDQPIGVEGITINITTNSGNGSDYSISGTDRVTTHTNASDPTITIKAGDTLIFDNTNLGGGHPMYIRVSDGGVSVSNPSAVGEGTNTVSWQPRSTGTFYYQCGVASHTGMIGTIVVQSAIAADDTLDSVTGRGAQTNNKITLGDVSNGGELDISAGNNNYLKIFAGSNEAYIRNTDNNGGVGGGGLNIEARSSLGLYSGGHITYVGSSTGSAELYYQTLKKLETNTSGVDITGDLGVSGSISDAMGPLRSLGNNPQNGTYTLVASDAGKFVMNTDASTDYTVNPNVFSAGDMVSIVNNSASDLDIIQGTGMSLYLATDGSTGAKVLSARGVCTILFVNATTGYISGSGLI
jgi:plastocyanin